MEVSFKEQDKRLLAGGVLPQEINLAWMEGVAL